MVLVKLPASFDTEGYRRRIRALRKLYDMNQTEFAAWTGIGYKKWNHYEQGYPIARESAWALRDKIIGISTDWIWFGDDIGVEEGLRLLLKQAERDVAVLMVRHHSRPKRVRRPVRRRIPKRDVRRHNGGG